jgi:hypothetical protein
VIGASLAGGFVGALVLATVLQLGTELRLTRIDLPFLVGTMFSAQRDDAKAIGFGVHAGLGIAFSLVYWAVFHTTDTAGWWQGALLGVLHGVIAATVLANVLLPAVHPRMGSDSSAVGDTPLVEPPGFLMLNYGMQTPAVTVLAHAAYGAIVGGFAALAA